MSIFVSGKLTFVKNCCTNTTFDKLYISRGQTLYGLKGSNENLYLMKQLMITVLSLSMILMAIIGCRYKIPPATFEPGKVEDVPLVDYKKDSIFLHPKTIHGMANKKKKDRIK